MTDTKHEEFGNDGPEAINDNAERTVGQIGEAGEQIISLFGRTLKRSDLFKLLGLVAFLLVMVGIVAALYPSFSGVFEEGGVERTVNNIREQGAMGVVTLLLLQFLQIVVAFIPGEVVQVAAGMLYGPFWGALLVLVGCVISSAVIYTLVHRLGAPFVQGMIGEKNMAKFRSFEESGKLNVIVFILFLIPGLPKDTFTYLVPLTDMKLGTFLALTTVGRIPGVLVSTFAAAGLATGDYMQSAILFAIAAVIALAGVLGYNHFMTRGDKK
jgi:uncharacterized membrane protein YdjX (TVP38/TMEM64 family)